jgi:hypothetical protein
LQRLPSPNEQVAFEEEEKESILGVLFKAVEIVAPQETFAQGD